MSFVWSSVNGQLVFIYAPNSAVERLQLWEELQHVILFDGALLILGDFYEITSMEEWWNSDSFSATMNQFNDFINSTQLTDLPLHGNRFTWRNSILASRIDRCLYNMGANSTWPFLTLLALPRRLLDHNPLLLSDEDHIDWGPKPF